MLCLGDCPKTFKSLTYNQLEINNFEFLKYFFLSSDVRYVQIVINVIRRNIDTYEFLKKDNGGVVYIVAQIYN